VNALYQPFPIPTPARGHIWHHVPETRRPRHFHAEPELNLIAAGRATFGAGEATIAVAAGDLLWWAPGQDHVLMDASPDFDLYVIGLTPTFSAQVLGDLATPATASAARFRLERKDLSRLVAACAASSAGGAGDLERRVGEVWREAHQLRVVAHDRHLLTRRTLESVLAQPELKRSDLAQLARGNASEVSRHFHQDIGLTLTTYRTRLRLLRFINLVDRGQRFLIAAQEAGFGSYSQCHRMFQHMLGCTPRLFFRSGVRDEMRERYDPWPTVGGDTSLVE
jgi:AraC-like DNA-binding protein